MTCSLVLLLLLLMMKNSNCSFPAVEIISVRSGEPVLLSADLTKAEQKRLNDLRWQHNGQLTLKNNMSKGDGGRCELLADGSLYFSRTETQDSGNYSMRAFDKDGTRIKTREILLRVLGESGSNSIATVSLVISCFLLLGFTVSCFIFMRRRAAQSSHAAVQENVYVEMSPSNWKEEDTYCALFDDIHTGSPVPQQDSPDMDGVYV